MKAYNSVLVIHRSIR